MRIYLDNCSFNRPFDDQHQIRIRIEAEAKLYIQSLIEQGEFELVWSYILEFENLANPYEFRRMGIQKWKKKAKIHIHENEEVLKMAEQLKNYALKAKDALHIACAIETECKYFITTDDKILNKPGIFTKKFIHEVRASRTMDKFRSSFSILLFEL